jgi:predicted Zn-dependent protease
MTTSVSFAQQENSILSAMKEEVERNKNGLKMDKLKPPFFIYFMNADIKVLDVSASLGALVRSRNNNYNAGISRLYVGDYQRSNVNYNNILYATDITVENGQKGIATAVWESMDRIYKQSAENYEAKQAIIAQRKLDEEEADLPDMEQTTPVTKIMAPLETNLNKDYWNNYACKSSEIMKKYPEIISSRVEILNRNVMMYTYNTEGTQLAVPHSYHMAHLTLFTRTDDGQELWHNLYIERSDFKDMPTLQQFIDTCEVTVKQLLTLRKAPLLKEAYSGPILFEGQAVAEPFQDHFFSRGTLITRRKSVQGQPGNSTEMIKDKKLISRSLSIKSLSGSQTYKGHKLEGYIPVDEEGVVPEQEQILVENGVLKNMLTCRIPTPKFRHSNGHGRLSFHSHSFSTTPGNVLLTSNKAMSTAELKKKLLDAAKEEDYEYAYIVKALKSSNATEVYRIYVADGREELFRGATLPDLNIKAYKRILGASDEEYYYTTYNFGVLTTYVVPEALLFEELEIVPDNNITFAKPYIVAQP